MKAKLPIVGVMGSGTRSHEERASLLGHWLADQGVHLLTGGSGTASEIALALTYQRPVIASLNTRDEIPGLPVQVPVRDDFDEVCKFVKSCLRKTENLTYKNT